MTLSGIEAELLEGVGGPNDRALLDELDLGSPQAAFQRLGKPIFRFLARLGVARANLEDATQDVFLVVVRRWDDFRGESSRKTWIFGIAVKVASAHRKRQGRSAEDASPEAPEAAQPTALALVAPNATAPMNPLEQAARNEARALVNRILEPLDDLERTLFVLVDMEGFKVPEVRHTLGLSSRRAHTILERIRRQLDAAAREIQ